jgi:hypothetical protein
MDDWMLLLVVASALLLGTACAELPIDANAPVAPSCSSKAFDLSPGNTTGLYEAGPTLSPGWYEIWCGRRTGNAVGQPDIWRAYGPVELLGGFFYIFDVVTKEIYAQNPRKIKFSLTDPLPEESEIWYKLSNESSYVVCFEGPYESKEQAVHEASGSNSSLEEEEILFKVASDAAVNNGPTNPTNFSLDRLSIITKIQTYHWNHGQGQKPGTIGLTSDAGKMYGPWQAYGTEGVGEVSNANWVAVTNDLELPPGNYTVVDSDPSTWSHNRETNGQGITWIYGRQIGNVQDADSTGSRVQRLVGLVQRA